MHGLGAPPYLNNAKNKANYSSFNVWAHTQAIVVSLIKAKTSHGLIITTLYWIHLLMPQLAFAFKNSWIKWTKKKQRKLQIELIKKYKSSKESAGVKLVYG